MSTDVTRRAVRREMHSPRTVAMIVAAVTVLALLAYLVTETVLGLLSQRPLLASPRDAIQAAVDLPQTSNPGVVVAVAAMAALLGLVYVVLAITPGRLSKHRLGGEPAVVVDNGVIAAALAQRVSDELSLPRSQVLVGVARRHADVTLRPDEGVDVDRDEAQRVAADEIARYDLTPPVRVRTRIERPRPTEDPA